MPACVIKKNTLPTPGGYPMIESYILPGENMYFFVEQSKGAVGDSILMTSDRLDRGLAVYSGPAEGRPMDPSDKKDRAIMAARCVSKHVIEIVMPDEEKPFVMYDYSEGHTEVIIAHVETWSYN